MSASKEKSPFLLRDPEGIRTENLLIPTMEIDVAYLDDEHEILLYPVGLEDEENFPEIVVRVRKGALEVTLASTASRKNKVLRFQEGAWNEMETTQEKVE